MNESMKSKTVVVIPAFMPSVALIALTDELTKAGHSFVVVDDGSGNEYQGVFDSIHGGTVLHHEKNKGKGASMKTAFDYISNVVKDTEIIVTMDCDGQHLIADAERIAAEVDTGTLVLGTRSFEGKIPLRSKLGNNITRAVFSGVAGSRVSDTQTGLRAFGRELLPFMLSVNGERYEYEMNVLLGCAKNDIAIKEVPIKTIYLDSKNSCSHFKGSRDSFRIYKNILKFASSSFVCFCIDYSLFLWLSAVVPSTAFALVACNIVARIVSAGVNYTLNSRAVFKGGKWHCLQNAYN